MHLREGERIIEVFHHHPTPFVYQIIKALVGASPFFFLLYIFQGAMSSKVFWILNFAVFTLFAIVILYLSLIYWLDKLIITNQRIVHVDWKYLTIRQEAEALLSDIQDVQSEEKGVLSHFKAFDYGFFRLDTASSHVTIEFFGAPNPEGIRQLIYHIKNTYS